MAVLFGIGFLIAGFIPPPSPDDSAQQIAAMYSEDPTAIRIGLIFTLISSALLGPYFAVLTVQMQRMEGVRPGLRLHPARARCAGDHRVHHAGSDHAGGQLPVRP